MKKAQMEILGLAIVVLLVLLAVIFVVRFVAFNKPSTIRNDFVTNELASNMLNTFLKTTAKECTQLITMTELLQDCAQGNSLVCQNGQSSCDFASSALEDRILKETFDKWKVNYYFTAYLNDPNSNILQPIGEPCTGQKKSKIFLIPVNPGTLYVKLDIC